MKLLLGGQDGRDDVLDGLAAKKDAEQDQVENSHLLHQREHVAPEGDGDGGPNEAYEHPNYQDELAGSVGGAVGILRPSGLPQGAVHEDRRPVQHVHG